MRQIRFALYGHRHVSYPYPPDTPLYFVAEEDIGKIVAAIFSDGDKYLNTTVSVVSEIVTPAEMAERASKVIPGFSPKYRKWSWFGKFVFEHIISSRFLYLE